MESTLYWLGDSIASQAVLQYNIYLPSNLAANLRSTVSINHSISFQYCNITSETSKPSGAGLNTLMTFIFSLVYAVREKTIIL